jgi:hypothetical protein
MVDSIHNPYVPLDVVSRYQYVCYVLPSGEIAVRVTVLYLAIALALTSPAQSVDDDVAAQGNVPASAAFNSASWSVMCLPSVWDRTDSTAVRPHRWARNDDPDGARMPPLACKGALLAYS